MRICIILLGLHNLGTYGVADHCIFDKKGIAVNLADSLSIIPDIRYLYFKDCIFYKSISHSFTLSSGVCGALPVFQAPQNHFDEAPHIIRLLRNWRD